MKPSQILLSTLSIIGCAQAATLIQNNFDSVDLGNYSGATGAPFLVGGASTDTLLGNASGGSGQTVGATGVNGSRSITTNDPMIRSRAMAAITTTTSFSTYFRFVDQTNSTDVNSGLVGAGWATASGTDGLSNFGGGANERFMIGLAQNGTAGDETKVQFVRLDRFGNDTSLALGAITLTFDTWYQLSFDLTFNNTDTNWDVANLNLQAWGADGLTGGASIASAAAVNNINGYSGINAASTAFAFVGGNRDRGAGNLDNIVVTNVPEPSLTLLGSLGALMILRRRRL